MFSLTKAAVPMATRNSSNIATNTRSRRANATMVVMTFCSRVASTGAAGTVDENSPVRDDRLAGQQPGSDLDHSVAGPPEADRAQSQGLICSGYPDTSRIALIDDRTLRHRRRGCRIAGNDAESGEHVGPENAVAVLDIGPNRQAVCVRINCRRHPRNLCLEDPTRIGEHANFDRLAEADRAGIGLADIGDQPDHRELPDPVDRGGRGGGSRRYERAE